MRHDGDSSAEEENNLKDYLRREARRERKEEKEAKEMSKERERDLKRIEEMQFNKEKIPEDLRQKY